MNLEQLNGSYLKFYFTENKNLPILLKNDGAIVILVEYIDNSNYNNTIISSENVSTETPMYSIWIGGEKIMSGYGLFPSSLDDLQTIIANINTNINNRVTTEYSDNNLLLRSPLEHNDTSLSNVRVFNSTGDIISADDSLIIDSRSNIGETYFIDYNLLNNPLYVQPQSMFYYVKSIFDKLNAPKISIENISYSITYVNNKYSIEQYLSTKLVFADQNDAIFLLPEYSIIKRISLTYTIVNLDSTKEYNGVTNISSGAGTIATTDYDIYINQATTDISSTNIDESDDTHYIITNTTKANISTSIDMSSDIVYTKELINNKDAIKASITLTDGTDIMTFSLPKMLFNSYDVAIGYVIKTTYFNETPKLMYINGNELFYDYILSQGDLFNLNLYDRIYILVNYQYQINELFIKCFYKNEHSKNTSYTNVTNVLYKYDNLFTYNGNVYNVYGINMINLFSYSTKNGAAGINRTILKATIEANNVIYTSTPTGLAEFNDENWYYNNNTSGYNRSNGWTISGGVYTSTNPITYLETIDNGSLLGIQELADIENIKASKIFNYIY